MPSPPLHGPALLFLYFKDKRRFDPLAPVASVTIIHLEPLSYFLSGECFTHRICRALGGVGVANGTLEWNSSRTLALFFYKEVIG